MLCPGPRVGLREDFFQTEFGRKRLEDGNTGEHMCEQKAKGMREKETEEGEWSTDNLHTL